MSKQVCPNCGSKEISETNSMMFGIGVPSSYRCFECDYEGSFILEVGEDYTENFKKELLKKKKKDLSSEKNYSSDTAYGNFLIKYWWIIFSPAILFILIMLFT